MNYSYDFPDGVWPTMITPYTSQNQIDYPAVELILDWYLENNAAGIFSVCLSSEMFELTIEERTELGAYIHKYINGRVPVIASGHINESINEQIYELNKMAETGVDALVFNLNRFADKNSSDDVLIKNMETVLNNIDCKIPLGIYECPIPYKRMLTRKILDFCKESGRFYFIKDTCCDLIEISKRLDMLKETHLKLYNANSATLYESLKIGCSGYSGVMANFHPNLYAWLVKNWALNPALAQKTAEFITLASLAESLNYPSNAKYHMSLDGLNINELSRRVHDGAFSQTEKLCTQYMRNMSKELEKIL